MVLECKEVDKDWKKFVSKHKDLADNFHVSLITKIGNKNDIIRSI